MHGLLPGGSPARSTQSPYLRVEKAAEALPAAEARESRGAEGGLRIGQPLRLQACKDAKGGVEQAEVERGQHAGGPGARVAEVGNQPKAMGLDLSRQVTGKPDDLFLGEAVEQKMADDEVCLRGWLRMQDGGLLDRKPAVVASRTQRARSRASMAALPSTA